MIMMTEGCQWADLEGSDVKVRSLHVENKVTVKLEILSTQTSMPCM